VKLAAEISLTSSVSSTAQLEHMQSTTPAAIAHTTALLVLDPPKLAPLVLLVKFSSTELATTNAPTL